MSRESHRGPAQAAGPVRPAGTRGGAVAHHQLARATVVAANEAQDLVRAYFVSASVSAGHFELQVKNESAQVSFFTQFG